MTIINESLKHRWKRRPIDLCHFRMFHIIEGRGQEAGHSFQNNEGRIVSTVSFDYSFVGDKGEITSQEQADVEEASMKILVVGDLNFEAVFGDPKRSLGDKGFPVHAIVKDIKWLGYTKVMLKADKEPAVLKFLVESLRGLRINGLEQVTSENPPD